ncbi:DUF6366 family protein [Jeotgalibacillus campisalis]|uniref:Phage capsid protein n=1 Tax=Jeotgalibacillus campisalis TaxID=220754 RepID=A0A0C2VIF4_9BACL|nr:DUF6366 family protein [Jeotgalibacillus campisalis]KIL48652.1 hypothetical protein KR50_12370 [Jeotgalibacillus campisalis]
MQNEKETPERRRERMRQEELKRNPSSSIHGSGLADLAGSLGWKGTGLLIVLILAGIFITAIFF